MINKNLETAINQDNQDLFSLGKKFEPPQDFQNLENLSLSKKHAFPFPVLEIILLLYF